VEDGLLGVVLLEEQVMEIAEGQIVEREAAAPRLAEGGLAERAKGRKTARAQTGGRSRARRSGRAGLRQAAAAALAGQRDIALAAEDARCSQNRKQVMRMSGIA